ncbi:MAG: sigma-70 family RNA polymerase sigma factor [Bacteroidetes bacterium]|nr:sigma-70 family RNA polymerase sigma factor [Bacteroidota bacterium]MDA1119091.1 sigma-70 family RNA polymerase sigma factor [Bacteroidota bacterium]
MERTLNYNGIELSEERLTHLCQQNDSKAQRVLYDRYADQMFRVCYRYIKRDESTEDVVTNGFIKVFLNIYRFEYRDKGSLNGWIKRIMINESLMFLRKKNPLFQAIDTADIQIKDSYQCDQELLAQDIYKLVRKLPKGYRTVFNMYVIDGYTHREIADHLNVSENTSKSQLSKARAHLRKMLGKYGIENE